MFGKYEDGEFCPLIKDKCVKRQCVAWMHVQGTDPNTGKVIDEWGCSHFTWNIKMMMEISQQTRQSGAATESFRNEYTKRQDVLNVAMTSLVGIADQSRKAIRG